MTSSPPIALSIAGSDPSGGAGIQADLKTFSALGVYGAAVVTALTAQNTREVRAVHVLPSEFVAQQIDAVFDDLAVDAVKLGMLASREIIASVAERLRHHGARNVVVDPVMVSKSGARLLDADAVEVLRKELVPLADVLTPNLPEAAVLIGVTEAQVLANREVACRALRELGCRAVVLKGGHAGGASSDDVFFDGDEIVVLSSKRFDSLNTHGSGCTFSAAIAAGLARRETRRAAIENAKRFVTAAIVASRDWELGHGHGPLAHFHAWWGSIEAQRD